MKPLTTIDMACSSVSPGSEVEELLVGHPRHRRLVSDHGVADPTSMGTCR